MAGSFLVSDSFHLLVAVSLKVTCWLSIPEHPWSANLQSLFFQGFLLFKLSFWLSFLVVIFSRWVESIYAELKVFPTTSPYSSSFWVPRDTSFFAHELSLSKLSGSLLHHWVLETNISVLRFLYFVVPLLSCLNPTLCCTFGDPEPLAASGYSDPILSLNFAGFFNGLFTGNININRALMLILLTAWMAFFTFHGMGFLVKFWPSTSLIKAWQQCKPFATYAFFVSELTVRTKLVASWK